METYLDNKQKQAIQKYLDTVDFQQIGLRALVEINLQKFLETYDAATAEGIPQADGWVAIETLESDFPSGGQPVWVTSRDNGEVRESEFQPTSNDAQLKGVKELWLRRISAWMPRPEAVTPAPYQRQSSEGE